MPTIQTKSKGQTDFFRCPKLFCRLISRTRCRKQLENLLPPEPGSHVRSLKQRVGHCFLACVQTQNLLLDRARGDEPVDRHRTSLSNAVGPVGGLVLNRRIPPGVKVYDIVGTGEVQAGSAGLQADQEKRCAALVEPLDRLAGVAPSRY